jgi:hypothetical protein
MKKVLAGLLIVFFVVFVFSAFSFAQKQSRSPADIKAEIKRVENHINTLNDKLAEATTPSRTQQLKGMIAMYEQRLSVLESELENVVPGSVPKKTTPQPQPPRIITPPPPQTPEPPRTIGISGGLLANIPAIVVEIRYNNPFNVDDAAVKLGLGFAKGPDGNNNDRQNVPLFITGIYNLVASNTPGLNPYIGGGINLNLASSYNGETRFGAFGADLLFGVSGDVGSGEMFAEVGYDLIRTGYSPDYQGLGFLLGYRQPW